MGSTMKGFYQIESVEFINAQGRALFAHQELELIYASKFFTAE